MSIDLPGDAHPLPVLFDAVVGQPDPVRRLRIAARNPVHAYLLEGPAGSGTDRAALAFAAALLCPDGGCGGCRHCRLALAGEHPDLTIVRRVGASMSADQASEVVRLVARSPIEGPRKVIVLDEFHLVAEGVAPKLLKTIEEPSATTTFVIVAEPLPPELVTIASRCVPVLFGPVPIAAVAEALVTEGHPPELAAAAAEASAGNLDRARVLAADPGLGSRRDAWRAVPARLDGTGATVATVVADLMAMLDDAQSPLTARHETETVDERERAERYGASAGRLKELDQRQKREILLPARTDELRSGIGTLAARYREALAVTSDPTPLVAALRRLVEASEDLTRNPNETLLLQALLLSLPPV